LDYAYGTSYMEAVNCRSMNKVLVLPMNGGNKLAQLNWLRELEKPHYTAGFSFCDSYPYDEGETEWVVELNSEVGLIPVFCSLYS